MTTDTPADELGAALAELQTQLPVIHKASKAQYGDYANLTDVSRELLPVMGKLGLSFSARPTIVTREDGTREFVLAYRLRHVGGQYDDGEYPLPQGSPQQLGSAITYARRYALCAVTGAVAEADDDGQAAEQTARKRGTREPPPIRPLDELPRNRDGSLSRSKCTEAELAHYGAMDSATQKSHNKLERDVLGTDSKGQSTPSTERLSGAPADLWDQPPPLRTPHAAGNAAGAIHAHFKRLGYTDSPEDRAARLRRTSAIIGREVTSTNDLTAAEGVEVHKFLAACRDWDALDERLAVKAGESMST